MKIKTCVFCDSPLTGLKSNEHIFPQWLLGFLKIKDELITPTHVRSSGELVSKRKHTLDELLAGRICKICNNGWMNDLENEVNANLKLLITADKLVVDLNPNERFKIARWTAKIAYLLNFGSNFYKNVPSDHFRFLKFDIQSLPKRVAVFGQQHDGKMPFNWIQSASWEIHAPNDLLNGFKSILTKESYKISFQFGKLILLISYLPTDELHYILWKGVHVPLFPYKGIQVAAYENSNFPWNNSMDAIIKFHYGLGTIHKSLINASTAHNNGAKLVRSIN